MSQPAVSMGSWPQTKGRPMSRDIPSRGALEVAEWQSWWGDVEYRNEVSGESAIALNHTVQPPFPASRGPCLGVRVRSKSGPQRGDGGSENPVVEFEDVVA